MFSHLIAYGASEIATKLSRLGVVIAVARTLDVAEIGVAAAALAIGDLLKSLTQNGIGQRIIAAPASELAPTCNRARDLFWVWCLGLFTIQCVIAGGVWVLTGNIAMATLILVLAGEYLFMPGGLVQAGLAMRAGKLKQTAAIAGGQTVLANLISVALAMVWPSALALVLPRLLTAPFWLVAMRRLHPWHSTPEHGKAATRPFIRFGWPILSTEMIMTARLHADKLIVGALLGPEILGLYFMAFNAGLSLASSFSAAFAAVLFPHLCAHSDRSAAMRQGFALSIGIVAPAVILQALLAEWYVPLLLGEGWDALAKPVSILCLVAIPTMLWTATAGWHRAENRPMLELKGTVLLTAAVMLNVVIAAPFGLNAIAWGYLVTASIIMLLLSRPALKFAFTPIPESALA
ncbi:oligosaccharide flippase family protein [Roseovarius sp.]|uniref:oligosaccharide flippase family protein n=1 Tax=Roseovarius sp. TaxID=1486281 RepID=UPI003D14256D